MEEWKDCLGFRNVYKVSNLGRVKSLNYNKTGKEQILKQNLCGEYLAVSMDNKRTIVHRLVAKYFIDNPDNLPEVDHINRVKVDNRLENLRWANKSQQAINRNQRQTQSGHNRIALTQENHYRVDIRRKGIYYRKTFQTLEEAIQARDKLLSPKNNYLL
jgi:hypothetical protein